jgi:murein DD-endopeptidase MepM/ murein hydrolase activator NlpD
MTTTAGVRGLLQTAGVATMATTLLAGAVTSQAGAVSGEPVEVPSAPAAEPVSPELSADLMSEAADAAKQIEIKREKRARARAQRSSGDMFTPTRNYKHSATFGQAGGWSSGHHTGLDFAAPSGTPVFAALAGKVLREDAGGAYGNHIVVRHDNGVKTLYAHLTSTKVSPGDKVLRGQVIGTVGSTGNSSGPHLHFEVIKNGTQRDPMDFL